MHVDSCYNLCLFHLKCLCHAMLFELYGCFSYNIYTMPCYRDVMVIIFVMLCHAI